MFGQRAVGLVAHLFHGVNLLLGFFQGIFDRFDQILDRLFLLCELALRLLLQIAKALLR